MSPIGFVRIYSKKMNTKKMAFILGGLIACCAVAVVVLSLVSAPPPEQKAPVGDANRVTEVAQKTKRVQRKKARTAAVKIGEGQKLPTHEEYMDDDEEAQLSDEFKKLLAELRTLSEAEDWDALLKLIRRIQASDEWPDGVPSILHEEAIDALSDMGKKGLPELIGYLGCDDEDLRDDAFDAIEDMFDDERLSDWDKNEMLKPFLRSLHDEEQLESLMDLIVEDMRNSCAVNICKFVLENGTAEAKQYLMEQVLEDLTGDENIRTKDQLDQWLVNNPDGEEDAEDYAGDKEAEPDSHDD